MSTEYYPIEYRLDLEDGSSLSYKVEIDKETLISRFEVPNPVPAWTKIDHGPGKCEECNLKDSEYCPIAIRLVEPIKKFGNLNSFARASVTVVTPERDYSKKTDVQEALRSLFGLLMATSGCPAMESFKCMARYHLPFSTLDETVSRIVSTYMLRQFFKNRGDKTIPVDLGEIETLYQTMQSLNRGMSRRLKSVAESDGSLNAIVILHTYSSLIPALIDEELRKLEPLFK